MGDDLQGLDEHVDAMQSLGKRINKAITHELNQLGNEWLGKTIDYTPHDTGFLASGAQGNRHAGDGKGGWHFLGVKREGGTTHIELVNQTRYAAAVEYGHRTINGGFVKGYYMLKRSTALTKRALPKVLHRAFEKVRAK